MRNNTPENLLQKAADTIKQISNNKCFGIVIESFSTEKEEYILSLHIISPKLKNYSYRIVELKCKNEINPFPISAILFAYAPTNNQYSTCNDFDSLSKTLDFFVNHSLTKMILGHIENMANLNDESTIRELSFTLNQQNKTEKIVINNPTRPLVIKKILVTSHFSSENNIWLNAVVNTKIKISCTGLISGGTISNSISLISFVSPYHNRPVFDLNLIFPSNADLVQFDQKLTNKLLYDIELESTISDIQLSVVYEVNSYEAHF